MGLTQVQFASQDNFYVNLLTQQAMPGQQNYTLHIPPSPLEDQYKEINMTLE